jgi:uncharacterized Ntn-hydrolase superfamily protein
VRTTPIDDNGAKLPITGKRVERLTRAMTSGRRRSGHRRLSAASVLAEAVQSFEMGLYALQRVADRLGDSNLDAVAKLSKVRSGLSKIINVIGASQDRGAA